MQQQAEKLKDWVDQYIRNVAKGLNVLDKLMPEMSESKKTSMFEILAASRFEKNF